MRGFPENNQKTDDSFSLMGIEREASSPGIEPLHKYLRLKAGTLNEAE